MGLKSIIMIIFGDTIRIMKIKITLQELTRFVWLGLVPPWMVLKIKAMWNGLHMLFDNSFWPQCKVRILVQCSVTCSIKAGTHEGACSRSTLLQHAPGAKLPRLDQRFLAKKYVVQQNFLLPHIKLVWYEGSSCRGKSVARVCFRSKLPRVHWNLLAVK